MKLGDFSDPSFRQWVQFRIQTFTDFMHEIDVVAKSVNPKIKTIPEIYPGIEQEAVRVGADVYSLYPVVDVIAHEYEFGGGDHMASSRTPADWFNYQVGMHTFRAFAEGKPTWILNYSWDGDKKVDVPESMMNLAMSQVMAGANFWDAPGHSMAGSNHLPTRKKIFEWIKENEKTFYSPRTAVDPVGVYFSPSTRNFHAEEFVNAFRYALIQLMQGHREFQIVTPRTLDKFSGKTLVLPHVRLLDSPEKATLNRYADSGVRIITIGDDQTGIPARENVIRRKAFPASSDQTRLPEIDREFMADIRGGEFARVEAAGSIATSVTRVN
ncbi:MAG: hypothetical protein JF563_05725, partial [Acidobacteriales bacterium]|nr:hypothetical protein [Terriglobales bacterium]